MIKQILSKLPKKLPKSESSDSAKSDSGNSTTSFGNVFQCTNVGSTISSKLNVVKRVSSVVFPASMNAGAEAVDPSLSFKDVSNTQKQSLFISKLNLCCKVYDMSDPDKNCTEQDVKRQTLLDLVDFVSSGSVKFTEPAIAALCKMCATNLFRVFPPKFRSSSGGETEDEEPMFDPAWSHLQVVYDLLLQFINYNSLDVKLAKSHVDHAFVLRLLDLFDSEDPRERDCLKTVLHRIYGKFMVHRPFIRKSVSNIIYRFVFETERHNGIAELLEIFAETLISDSISIVKTLTKTPQIFITISLNLSLRSTMASSSSSGLTFKLHPLVIVNISDHYTRVKSQMNPTLAPHNNATNNGGDGVVSSLPPPRVFGCVIGVQKGRTVEIFNSFELLYDPSTHSLDRPFLEKKQELYKKVFPHFYILGWYSTGSDAEESDMHIHKALMDINESPVYVLLNPAINHSQKDLPVSIFESELHVIDGIPQLIFVRSSYTIETVEAERISVDHVAHLKPSDGGSAATQLAANLTGIHSAIKMLHSRIKVLHHYLLAMEKGDVPCENSLLRQVSSLLRRLPAIESGKFQDDFLMEYNDTLLISYLAMLTNCSSAMNDLVDKFSTAYDRHTRRGGRTAFM